MNILDELLLTIGQEVVVRMAESKALILGPGTDSGEGTSAPLPLHEKVDHSAMRGLLDAMLG